MMSSRKWLSQNGMSQMKRISSSSKLATQVDDQENMPTHDDVWSSILYEKKDNNFETNFQTPPYVHPLLRKPTSILSQKSLEICTESLGSESASDGFSLKTSDDQENEKEEKIEQKIQPFEDFQVEKYNYNPSQKKMAQKKSFPPPLPSFHIQSHRKNGRLVLEAVSFPQQNYLQVDRQEGRLLLTLIKKDPQEPNIQETLEEKLADFQQVFDNFQEFDVNEVETEEEENKCSEDEHADDQMAIMIGKISSSLPTSGMINIPMMKSILRMGKKDTILWSNKINKVVDFMEAEQVDGKFASITKSLPPLAAVVTRVIPLSATKPPPPTTTTGADMVSFNVYEYFWRRDNKTSVAGIIDSSILRQQCYLNNLKDCNNDEVVLAKKNSYEQEMVIMRGNKGGFFVPLVCRKNNRSLLIWQPHCIIATS